MKTPKYNLGDKVTFKDPYWGMQTGTIDIIGYQGQNVVYGLTLENGINTSSCKESQIKRKLNY